MITADCIIVAGGIGKRLSGHVRKQFLLLKGKEILVHSIQAFMCCPQIREIVVVSHPDDISFCDELIKRYCLSKVKSVIPGGAERQQSVYNGLCNNDSEIILIHDAVRPFIKQEQIEKSIYSADKYGACVVATRVKDTIKVADKNGFAVHTPERSTLYSAQTPQAFRREIIIKAHMSANEQNFIATDDCSLVERIGYPVKIIEGDYSNIKITTSDDLVLAERLCQNYKVV